jgi:predicted PurR-regulated permease PerM
MTAQRQANYIINIGLHVYILFSFLTVFFFLYASKLAKKSINHALDDLINKETEKFLSKLDEMDAKISEIEIDWKEMEKIAYNIEQNSQGTMKSITKHNDNLRKFAIGVIIGFGILLLCLYVYFRMVKGYKVHVGSILLENLVIFSFIGLIEYLFFTRIASKYIPVTPDFVTESLLERIKYQISNRLTSQYSS